MSRSDIISVHAPLVHDTYNLIDQKMLGLAKQDAIIVNTGRGPVIDEQALVEALNKQQIAGAALDVIEKEPLDPNHPFINMDNVILTPHAAFYSDESCRELKYKAAKNVTDVLTGGQPTYWVNRF
jgi:D-3-phosphoglycerate dehydrogenase / 2-oxoglutarate reductase